MNANYAYEVALQTVFVELCKAVASVTKTTPKFRTLLNRLHTTLTTIEPVLYGNGRLARVLINRPEKDTKLFVFYLDNAKETVLKCSRVKCWNVYKKFVHANKLIRLDNELLKFFRVELEYNIGGSMMNLDLGDELDRALSTVAKRAGGFSISSSSNVVDLPDVIIGFDLHLRELKRLLFDSRDQVLVVSAPGGCGKTTLVKMVCHDDEIKGIYGENIFYVTVSRTTSLKAIVQKLFAQVENCEFKTDEEARNQLESMMRQLGSQKILLVLDDVWSESESLIDDLKFPIPGYTILVTSRFMFSRIGSAYKLSLLNDEDARTLLCHFAFHCDGSQVNVPDDLVTKMVKCCKGFPLALTVIGASLRNQAELEWRRTLQKWSEGESIFDSNKQILVSLQASVDALDDLPIARECFLDLGLFPEDEKISASTLMDLWVELYDLDKEGMYTSEYLLELSSRNLLSFVAARKDASEIEGYCNEHYVTQHDLLRELAIHLSSQDPIPERERLFIEIHGNRIPAWWIQQTQQPSETRLLSISTDETFSSSWYDLKAPKVQALVLNIRSKEYTLPHFIKNFTGLKVLIITGYGIYPTKLHELQLISTLPNLKRIRLEHISLSSSIQSIFELESLEKLSFIMCEIGSVFKTFTHDLPMLPHLLELEFESCFDLRELPEALCRLDHLEKLSITNCHELETLPNELGNLSNLGTLRLHSCTRLADLPGSIGSLQKLIFLDISDCLSINSLPDQIGELHGLRVLKMSGCHGLEELPASVTNLSLLEDVISDEETSYLWSYYESDLSDLKINIVEEDRFASFKKIIGY